MRRHLLPAILFLTSMLLVAMTPGAATAHGQSRGDPSVPLCFVPKRAPHIERTIHVPSPVADRLVRKTLSYHGPCASYGESAPLGNGALTAFSQSERGVPSTIGLLFRSSTLDGLPFDPPTAGLWCFDRDGDGVVDEQTECSGGYENALHLSQAFRTKVDTPFTYLLINWNPHGHIPPGVYDVPHFDIHFYLNSNEERLAIRPGPCPQLVNCDDYELGKILPAEQYRTADHMDVDAVEPAMGNHLIDVTGPEFAGEAFTHSFIYGVWDGHITFYEPMVTHQWFTELSDGTRTDECFALKLPAAWERAGWYPTEYCLRYRENRDELIASLEGFVYREAS
jgi:hypothetical protein